MIETFRFHRQLFPGLYHYSSVLVLLWYKGIVTFQDCAGNREGDYFDVTVYLLVALYV